MARKRKRNVDDDPGERYLSPYEVWNFGYGKDFAFPGIRKWKTYFTVLTELPPASAERLKVKTSSSREYKFKFWLPTRWKEEGLQFVPFVVKNALDSIPSPTDLANLLRNIVQLIIQIIVIPGWKRSFVDANRARFRVAFPVPDYAMHDELPPEGPDDPECHPEKLSVGKGKRITVIAVIDDGLPFAHRSFRNTDGDTRVEFCWLQSIKAEKSQKTVLFGREYERGQIDELIRKYGEDEDRLYREAGATQDTEDFGSLIDRHATHGAHVMDLATGYATERGDTAPNEIRIIAVQLPNTIAWDTSGFGKDMYMLSAFHYIFNRADIIAKRYGVHNLRLVINFSYGFSGGRHDGGTELEAAIEELVERRRTRKHDPSPTALVVPAGNTFLERMHGVITPSEGRNSIEVRWRIQPNDRTPSYLELWFGESFDPTGYAIEIWDPWNKPRFTMPIAVDQTINYPGDPIKCDEIYEGDFAVIGQASVDHHRRERWRVLVVLAPTEPEDISHPHVASGEWTILIKGEENAKPIEEPVRCWIQRAADPESLRSGSRQSYFDDPRNGRYTLGGDLSEKDTDDAFVRRFGSLNGLATGAKALVVAGYRLGAGLRSTLACTRPARYSSAGTIVETDQRQVDCSSMSDRSRVLPGTIAGGVRSGSLSFVQGTSAAAPFVARQLAETFVVADDSAVWRAECENYRPLLYGYWPEAGKDGSAGGDSQCGEADEDLTRARLGAVRVPPHWQPEI